jgi:hypothetical protein
MIVSQWCVDHVVRDAFRVQSIGGNETGLAVNAIPPFRSTG